jgi:YVTN family beta-propeller protein
MAELPAGTVTLLFTDIEGSTGLLKRLRDRYADVLGEHERILRSAIDGHGGQVVDTQGDALFAAFPRARAAVAAAVAGQRALAAEEWPEGVAVRVRMGLHSGEPAVGSDRYVGMGVHRAARISAAAHGGQVLLSGATRALVEDELPDDVRIVDLGEFRLKDIDRPERLHQLVVEGLPADFPPPRTDEGDAAAVALADAVEQRRLVPGRRTVVTLVAAVLLVVAGVAAYAVAGGGSSHAAVVAADSVGFIDARTGRIGGQFTVDQAPTSVAVGDGAVWAANSTAGTVSRVDPSTGATQTISVGASPTGIAVGGGGVWVANNDDGTVSWISPQSNTVVKTITVGAGPTAVAYGFGSVWVTNADDRTVTRIDAASGDVQRVIGTKAVGGGITVGGGSVWVTDEATRSVYGIDPASNSVSSTATVGAGPIGIAYGDGSLWVANSLDSTVSRVDVSTLSTQTTIPIAGGPSSVSFSRARSG